MDPLNIIHAPLQVDLECGALADPASTIEKRDSHFQPGSPYPSTPLTEAAISYNPLAAAISMELTCMDEMGLFINSIPEEMCYLSKQPIAANRNTQCWTGTELGRCAGVKFIFAANHFCLCSHPHLHLLHPEPYITLMHRNHENALLSLQISSAFSCL